MKPWNQRPIEIRNLFNPAFCGLVLYRAMRGYEENDPRGIPFSLTFLILPLCLHKQTREILQKGNRSYFLKLAANHPELAVNFGRRASALVPFTLEALGLLMQMAVFTVDSAGRLKTTQAGVKKTVDGTPETIACQRVAKFVGKEFSSIGDRVTIYTTLNVRP
jgi:Family of unknown function (DUF6521)